MLKSIFIVEQVLKTSDEVKVKAQLLRMVHSLFHQVLVQIVLDLLAKIETTQNNLKNIYAQYELESAKINEHGRQSEFAGGGLPDESHV